eukprot:m.700902 g.700902  ORF g.700902 m.700902 type:complete len:353 (-) comp58709_c0_seq21:107-1165(-)
MGGHGWHQPGYDRDPHRYGPPPPDPMYDAPYPPYDSHPRGPPGYAPPPSQQGYGAPPPSHQGYGAPPPHQGYDSRPPPSQGYGGPPPQGYGASSQGYGAPPPSHGYGASHGGYDRPSHRGSSGQPSSYGPPQGGPGCVIMVYNLSANATCDNVFNLCCLYGNVVKIKFLHNKTGTAMVQMEDSYGAQSALDALTGVEMFGAVLYLTPSKLEYIAAARGGDSLPNGSPAVSEYVGSSLNRFSVGAEKNRRFRPNKCVHYFNAPIDWNTGQVNQMFTDAGVKAPIFHRAIVKPGAKTSSGMLEFETVSDAVEAVSLANHTRVTPAEHKIYTIKLSFSSGQHSQSGQDLPEGARE